MPEQGRGTSRFNSIDNEESYNSYYLGIVLSGNVVGCYLVIYGLLSNREPVEVIPHNFNLLSCIMLNTRPYLYPAGFSSLHGYGNSGSRGMSYRRCGGLEILQT